MNKTLLIKSIKAELNEIEIQLAMIEDFKQSITCRKTQLETELEAVGASAPARKGKKSISPVRRAQVRAELTKGARPWNEYKP